MINASGYFCVVEEYIDGWSLEEYCRQERWKLRKIEQLENRLAEIDEEFLVPENATNVALLNDLTKERNSVEEELNTMYEQWEELSSEE